MDHTRRIIHLEDKVAVLQKEIAELKGQVSERPDVKNVLVTAEGQSYKILDTTDLSEVVKATGTVNDLSANSILPPRDLADMDAGKKLG